MASKRFEKSSEEWQMFAELWNICQRFWEPEDNDEYWEQVFDAVRGFNRRHEKYDKIFSMKMSLAFIDVLDRKLKASKSQEPIGEIWIPMSEKNKKRLEDMRNE